MGRISDIRELLAHDLTKDLACDNYTCKTNQRKRSPSLIHRHSGNIAAIDNQFRMRIRPRSTAAGVWLRTRLHRGSQTPAVIRSYAGHLRDVTAIGYTPRSFSKAQESMQNFVTDKWPSPQRIACSKQSHRASGGAVRWVGCWLGSQRNFNRAMRFMLT